MKWIPLIIGLLIPLGLAAQANEQKMLDGIVLEENDQGELAPLIGASVHWLGTTIGTSTNEKGHFSIEDHRSKYKLVVSYVGYQSDTIKVTNSGTINITLGHATLNEFEVNARKQTTKVSYMNPLLVQNMDEEELFKAACCNLSESFETNPAVDVSFTDAVTGTRQIRMLGLDGRYTMLSQENMPGVRGIASIQGLTFTPGSWVKSIQVTKGTGSVINGFESLAGQINTELKKPNGDEILFVNGYYNQPGRREGNLNTRMEGLGKKKYWSNATLVHAAERPTEIDNNDDGFLDNPKTKHLIGMHRWMFNNKKGLMGQVGIQGIMSDNFGGQPGYDFDEPAGFQTLYGVKLNSRRVQGFTKTGFVFPKKRYKSIGFQTQWTYNEMETLFGLRLYNAKQRSAYTNLIYQSIIGNTNHKFKTGLSFSYDEYDETYTYDLNYRFDFQEKVPGAFFEYSYDYGEKFNIVAGIRADNHNLFGAFVTPRLHLRYAISEKSVIRASGGRGQRTANILAENMGYFASGRTLNIGFDQDALTSDYNRIGYGFLPEVGWNMGLSFTQEFRFDYRDGQLVIDAFRTQFTRQTVVDLDKSPQHLLIYNVENGSYSNSIQAQLDYELLKRLDLRLAYRWLDVQTDYQSGTLTKPLLAEHRAFVNVAYETRSDWKFDYTVQWQGPKRVPVTSSNPEPFQRETESPAFFLMNAQVSKKIGNFLDVYLGMENVLDYKQDNPITGADAPFSDYFDASLVWAPIFGRTTYIGFRFVIKEKKETISDS